MDGQFSDAEDESGGEVAFNYSVDESGCSRWGSLYACIEVCDEFCAGIPCESKSMQASMVVLETAAKGQSYHYICPMQPWLKQWLISSQEVCPQGT